MPCAEFLTQPSGLSQGKQAGSRHDPVAPDNDRTVMQGRILFKDIQQQTVRHQTVNGNTGFNSLFQTYRPFKDDQGADFPLSHDNRSVSYRFDHIFQFRFIQFNPFAEQTAPANLLQSAAQFRLENHGQRNHHHGYGFFQNPVDDVKVQPFADDNQGCQHHQSFD